MKGLSFFDVEVYAMTLGPVFWLRILWDLLGPDVAILIICGALLASNYPSQADDIMVVSGRSKLKVTEC